MQLMTWPLARLGSRFGLLFEPHHRRVMHSALGRFMDQPLDLAVGLVEADGTERVLPFTRHGELFYACEQFERNNSITFRGYDEQIGLKFELNFHSVFYPQDEQLCILPAFYMELRVTWARRIRWLRKGDPSMSSVRLFVRLSRPDTEIQATDGRIDLNYDVPLAPRYIRSGSREKEVRNDACNPDDAPTAHVAERIQSLNDGAEAYTDERGHGLALDLPVTEEGSGTKWRLVWAAHTADPVLQVRGKSAHFRYNQYWSDLDAVMAAAVAERDENLAHSRRFEKLLEQAPHIMARRHLTALGFQSFLSNTFWCDVEDGSEWFSNWEGTCLYHSTVDVEYNLSLLYFAIWPELLVKTVDQWVHYGKEHTNSGGLILSHDMGQGMTADKQAYPHEMPVEENSNFLLLLQAYCHWTGGTELISRHAEFIGRLTDYLLWTDRDDSGFPSEGTANTIDDASAAVQYARKQTYLAVKRVMALLAAADLLSRAGHDERATRCRDAVRHAAPRIDSDAWIGDHYVVCIERDTAGLIDVWSGKPLPMSELQGWDAYSIYTANGLLLPQMINARCPLDVEKLRADITNAMRETLTTYGCSHSTSDQANVWVSQNIWRDLVGRYLGAVVPMIDSRYWDLQTFSNTADQSFGFIDTYIGNELAFYPRGAAAFGYFLAGPRIRIDRLADRDGGAAITVQPDLHRHSRWPLLPLADWQAGKIPVCVVDGQGRVTIEGAIEDVTILSGDNDETPEG